MRPNTWQEADAAQQKWAAEAADETASPEVRAAARAGIEALDRAKMAYNRAQEEANGDPARLKAATDLFEGLRQGIADAVVQATTSAPVAPGHTAFASLRQPEKVGNATVRPGATVWELSQGTGVPVERILEFNAQMGQPIDPDRLQVGQEILVPLGADEVRFRPKTAEEVQRMWTRRGSRSGSPRRRPRLSTRPRSPLPLGAADPRERALALLQNDRALIAEDEGNSRFDLISPSTLGGHEGGGGPLRRSRGLLSGG